MEQRTIGKFITTLRKANGMTQKELADKLNVSDKTVSRWERDDGAPDLSVIPVIAEIFGVTCDELLRGERKSPTDRTAGVVEEPTAKGEKQRKRILAMGLSAYRDQTFVAMGLSVIGLIAAMICNLGFLRGYIGFFVGAIFYVASFVFQAICTNRAFQKVSDDTFCDEETGPFRTQVIYLAKRGIFVTAVLIGVTVPLIVFPYDTYMGLDAASWLLTGLLFGGISFVLCQVIWYFLHGRFAREGVVTMDEKQKEEFLRRRKLQRVCAVVLVVALTATAVAQISFNETNPAWHLARGTEFNDYESFARYMEQDIDADHYGGTVVAEPSDTVYYDQYGNEIPEEEAIRGEVRIYDGSPEGKVVCTYIRRNEDVFDIKTSNTKDGLPIMVITHSDYHTAQQRVEFVNLAFVALYVIECVSVWFVYRKRRSAVK